MSDISMFAPEASDPRLLGQEEMRTLAYRTFMTTNGLLGYSLLAVAMIAFGYVVFKSRAQRWCWWRAQVVAVLVGVALAVGTLGFHYHYSPYRVIYGFPFVTAFEVLREDGVWVLLADPAVMFFGGLFNALIALCFPHVFIAAYVRRTLRFHAR